MSTGGSSGGSGFSGGSAGIFGMPTVSPTAAPAASPTPAATPTPTPTHVSFRSAESRFAGSQYSGTDLGKMAGNSGLVAGTDGHFGEYKAGSAMPQAKTIAKPEADRSPFDTMQPGRVMESQEEKPAVAAKPEETEQTVGSVDPSLTPQAIADLNLARNQLLMEMNKIGNRSRSDGTNLFVQVQQINTRLGLSINDMGGWDV
jgi:hypothetical protein